MARFLQVVRDLALLLARVGLGWVLIMHGIRRWQDQGIESQIAYLKQFATPFATYAAWGGTLLEIVGGIFLIVGALTPLVAAAIVAEQVLIVLYTSWYKTFYVNKVSGETVTWQGGYEYSVVIALLALLLVVHGSGRIGIDRLFRRRKPDEDEADAPTPAASGDTGRTTGPTGASRSGVGRSGVGSSGGSSSGAVGL
ncbi:DoxX family protein [Microlunatus soli]|uniref:Putative oxidoreductase n=1 Tax=Microlunatus soli TaxID=630515 RepID=A0A1H1VIE2_9ACTN|nr:DoxX family protein [Microlunatus soli]SDS84677.1 putative oxidoreductase [Microlunatus soli]